MTRKLHSNFVIGFTRYKFIDVKEFELQEEEQEEIVFQGDFINSHFYGIVNLMYDPFSRMTIGLELDYGWKDVSFNGLIDGIYQEGDKRRDAMRISFGFMFYI